MKNVTLIPVEINGRSCYGLLDPQGHRIIAFDAFASSLARSPFNTRAAYCRNLARFFDYLIEASHHLSPTGTSLKRDDLVEIVASYQEYLLFGGGSGNEIARRVNSTLPSPLVSAASCDSMFAPIRRFLEISESLRTQLEQLAKRGYSMSTVDPLPLIPRATKQHVTRQQAASMLASSMLAGVLAGGPKLLAKAALPNVGGEATYDEKRAFPFDRVVPLIQSMPSWRDKALYAFCAASGCRVSEALQLLWSDVKLLEGTVKLVDPARRINNASYQALSPRERDQLVWKGRATQATLLIDPFASMFFEALEKYVKLEYMPHGLHEFVFQHRRTALEGRPYFLSAASSRNQLFGLAMAACIPESKAREGLGVHSLRHMYGTYLLNYFPRLDGTYGLPIGLVKQLMGHKSIKSTERYARHDTDLLERELVFANLMVYGNSSYKTLNQMKRDALHAKLMEVERMIAEETVSPPQLQRGAR